MGRVGSTSAVLAARPAAARWPGGRGAVVRPRPRSPIPVSVPGAARALPAAAQVSWAAMRRRDTEPAGWAFRPVHSSPEPPPTRGQAGAGARGCSGAVGAGFAAATGAAGWTAAVLPGA